MRVCEECGGPNRRSRKAKYCSQRCNSAVYYRRNREAVLARQAEQRAKGDLRDRERASYLKRYYGLTPEQYDQMVEEQGGVCKTCGAAEPGGSGTTKHWRIDHDHVTGAVRGLLCNICNQVIGFMKDDPEVAMSIALYLEHHRAHPGPWRVPAGREGGKSGASLT